MENKRFETTILTSEDGIQGEFNTMDPREVLREQIKPTPTNSIIIKPSVGASLRSHSINSNVGTATMEEKISIEASNMSQINWRTYDFDGEDSFIELLQIVSDNSQTSLILSSFTFYPLHLNLVNFKESSRREKITSGRSIVVYLPIYLFPIEGNGICFQVSFHRMDKQKFPHETANCEKKIGGSFK